MRIIKSIFCLSVCLFAVFFNAPLFSGEPAVIVTVDGLSFANTLLLPDRKAIDDSEHYLKAALDNMSLNLEDTTIDAFPWSRDANDTLETVEELHSFLLEKYTLAVSQNKRFIIVAHSWGSVLSYLALATHSTQVPESRRIYVDLYITLGSPLGTDNAHDGINYPEESIVIDYTADWVNQYAICPTCFPLVEKWSNFWAWGDVISGPFQGFMPFAQHTEWSDNQIDSGESTVGYLGRNTTTTAIWHKYDSLQPGGLIDNQPLLDQVKSLLEDNPPESDNPPFGRLDSPLEDSTVRNSVAVTGWALDDTALDSVKIYRVPISGEGNDLIFIGDVSFVEGARPDIEAAYPDYSNNSRAGWGYMMLTHFLPNGGNGTFTLYAIATDNGAHSVTLGSTTVTCDNNSAVKPFGAIDTPTAGGIASGSAFLISGWVLTPQPASILENGSTINVYVDGVNLGHPVYDIYREDVATLFPGYANSNGAHAYFYLDTTSYANGVHSIAFTATDDAGNSDGIGSRYFSIFNSNPKKD